MADLATEADAAPALAAGVDILGTTLAGYLGDAVPAGPDLALVAAFARLGRPVFAEGRYHRPEQAAAAIAAGATAVVVGSAITRVEHITSWFAAAVR
jgi:putative N-acetylmannosamine-6-phosphate epimerase